MGELTARIAASILLLLPGGAIAAQEAENNPQPDIICGDDVISPVLIDHIVDEIYAAGALQESFNFLDYHFEKGSRYMQARAYLDDVSSVVIYGPFESDENLAPVSDDAFKGEVVAYLKRRYSRVEETSGDGSYSLVWELSENETPDLSKCEPINANQQ